MSATLNLFVNRATKTFMRSRINAAVPTLPWFGQSDIDPWCVAILYPDPNNQYNFSAYDITGLSLTLTVEKTDGTVLVSQSSWTKDTNLGTFTANVTFDTVAMNTFLGSNATATATLKLRLGDGAASTTVIEQPITIHADATAAGVTPVSNARTLTFEEAEQIFAKKLMGVGETITFRTADGLVGRILGVYKDGTTVIKQDDLQNL